MASTGGGDWRARAEARRRRVLEGGAARLAAISGREPPAEHVCATIPPLLEDAEEFSSPFENHHEKPFTTEREEPSEEPHGFSEPSPIRKRSTVLDTVFETRMHVLLYSSFVYIMFTTNNVTDSYMFVPLLMWEFAELCYSHAQQKTDEFQTRGMLAVYVVRFVLNKSSLIFKDACVYTFTIVVLNILVTEFSSFR